MLLAARRRLGTHLRSRLVAERNGTGCWRWTDGEALLGAGLRPHAGPFVLRIEGRFALDSPHVARPHVAQTLAAAA